MPPHIRKGSPKKSRRQANRELEGLRRICLPRCDGFNPFKIPRLPKPAVLRHDRFDDFAENIGQAIPSAVVHERQFFVIHAEQM